MNRWNSLRLRWKLLVSFGVVLILTSVQAIFTYSVMTQNEETTGWVDHSYEVIDMADEALSGLVDMETSYRGYLVTGENTFLDLYQEGKLTSQGGLEKLQELTSDTPEQVARWKDLESRIQAWQLEVTDTGISLRASVTDGVLTFADLAAFETSALLVKCSTLG